MSTKTDWEKRVENTVREYGSFDGERDPELEIAVLDLLREFAEEAAGIALAHDTTEPHTHNSPCHEVIWSEILSLLPKKED